RQARVGEGLHHGSTKGRSCREQDAGVQEVDGEVESGPAPCEVRARKQNSSPGSDGIESDSQNRLTVARRFESGARFVSGRPEESVRFCSFLFSVHKQHIVVEKKHAATTAASLDTERWEI